MNREAPWAMSRDDAAYLLSHLVESAAENDPTHIAMVSRKRQLSCGEMHSRSNALARLLFGSGVRKGDRVGISLNKKHADGEGTRFFQGRKDRQIESRGYRVELDEVEAVLLRHQSRKGPCCRSPVPGRYRDKSPRRSWAAAPSPTSQAYSRSWTGLFPRTPSRPGSK